MKIESIVFDFDGVLVQSNYIRTQTYFDIFNHIPHSREIVEEAISEDKKRDRYGIIEASIKKMKDKNFMQVSSLEEETKKYVCKYNEITERMVSLAPEVPWAEKSLEFLIKRYPLFIITGTIQKSIDVVLENRGLKKYFKKVYGGFRDKKEGMKIFIEEQKKNPKKSIFVGDGQADYECAEYYDLSFVAVINETNDFEKKQDIWKIYNLKKLPDIVTKIEKLNENE